MRILLVFLVLIGALSVKASPLPEDSDKISSEHLTVRIPPSTILGRLEESMQGIRDLSAQMAFQIYIKKLGFPFSLHADYYFKSPDKVKIALRGIPGLIAEDVPKTITAATTLSGFRKDYLALYHSKLQGIRTLDARSCYQLELTPIATDGNVAKTILWVNRENFTIPRMITQYKDGSWVQVNRTYASVQGHLLVRHIEASMNFVQNNLEADVKADYSAYKLNQGLSDSLFEEKKKGS